MALRYASGTLTTPTSTGSQTYSVVSDGSGNFTGKLLILYAMFDGGVTAIASMGFATSSSKRWAFSARALDAVNPTDSGRQFVTDKCISLTNDAGTVSRAADFTSFASGQFTLNWTTVLGAHPLFWIVLGGDDLLVDVGTWTFTTGTGSLTITGVDEGGTDFEPGALITGCSLSSTTTPGWATFWNLGLGATDGTNQFALAGTAQDAATPDDTDSVLVTDKVVHRTNGVLSASFTSFGTGEFTTNKVTAPGSNTILGYVALGGTAQFKVNTFAQNDSGTGTGNQSITGSGFQAAVDLFLGIGKASSASDQDGLGLLMGHAISSSSRGVSYNSAQDNVATSNTSRYRSTSFCISATADGGTTAVAEADFVSQDSDGLTINNTTVDGTSRVIGFLSIGAAAAAGGALVPFMRPPDLRGNMHALRGNFQ